MAVAASLCAIAYSFDADVPIRVSTVDVKNRLFCWAEPQGMVRDADLCAACRFREAKYNTIDTAVSMVMLREAGDDIRSRKSTSSDNNSVAGRPSTDTPTDGPSTDTSTLSPRAAADAESSKKIGR